MGTRPRGTPRAGRRLGAGRDLWGTWEIAGHFPAGGGWRFQLQAGLSPSLLDRELGLPERGFTTHRPRLNEWEKGIAVGARGSEAESPEAQASSASERLQTRTRSPEPGRRSPPPRRAPTRSPSRMKLCLSAGPLPAGGVSVRLQALVLPRENISGDVQFEKKQKFKEEREWGTLRSLVPSPVACGPISPYSGRKQGAKGLSFPAPRFCPLSGAEPPRWKTPF